MTIDFERYQEDKVAAAVRQPALAELMVTARRRRRRRRAMGVAAVAVLAVGVAAPLARSAGGEAEPAESPLPMYLAEVNFVAPESAVVARYGGCSAEFIVTTNAGRTWSEPRGPESWRDCPIQKVNPVWYNVYDAQTFTVSIHDRNPARERHFVTLDQGITWKPLTESEPVDRFPATARPSVNHGSGINFTRMLDTATGKLLRLAEAPPSESSIADDITPDGALWRVGSVTSAKPATDVIVSTDRGHSWYTARNVIPADADDISFAAVDSRRAYVIGSWNGGYHLRRTTDGGRTWSAESVAIPTPPESHLTLAVATDERLVVMAWRWPATGDLDLLVWVSEDQGVSFRAGTDVDPVPPDTTTCPDLMWLDSFNSGTALVTDDGDTWTTLAIPSR